MSKGARLVTQEMVDNAIAMGVNPVTGKPLRINPMSAPTPEAFRMMLRVLDEQRAVNRYVWYNLPSGLTGQLIERMLYYRGSLAFFHVDDDPDTGGTFYMLPYTGTGTPDPYGRWNKITPLQFTGPATAKDEVWIPGLTKNVIKEFPLNPTIKDFEDGCVLLWDYTKQLSEKIVPRQVLQEPLLSMMSEIFPLIRTNLYANSGVMGMRVQTSDDGANVAAANKTIAHAALSGEYLIPIVGLAEFQDITTGNTTKIQEYLMALESFDNFALQMYGLKNGGIFDKSQYVNNSAVRNVQQNVGLQYQDGLTLRQEFCDIVNAVWGTFIWCDASDVVLNYDTDMDGAMTDEQDQSGTYEGRQPEAIEGEDI